MILQARTLAWVAVPSSRGSSRPRDPGLLHCWQILYCLSHLGSLNTARQQIKYLEHGHFLTYKISHSITFLGSYEDELRQIKEVNQETETRQVTWREEKAASRLAAPAAQPVFDIVLAPTALPTAVPESAQQ